MFGYQMMGILINKMKYKQLLKSNFKQRFRIKTLWEMKIPKNILARVIFRAEMLNMARNKTPGNDGLTIEFYEKFWPLISKQLVDSFNSAYENNLMSVSQRQGTIKLIPKPNKDFIEQLAPF